MKLDKAPVALFVYKRPEHTQRTLDSLAANPAAKHTNLIVFSDGPKSEADFDAIKATRQIVAAAQGFKSVELVERSDNLGLAENIADGVTQVMNRFGRAIVLEDDIETSAGFLDYMNAALDYYEDAKRVWHISGWNYPISADGLPDFFFWPVMNCWGWASWADRWQNYSRDPDRICREWGAQQRARFDLDGAHYFFEQVEDNASGRLKTWAIFWYATIFEAEGLCLNPAVSYVRNIGLDGSGEHCLPAPERPIDLQQKFVNALPKTVEINHEAVRRIKDHLTIPLHRRIARKIKRNVVHLIS